MFNSLLEKLPPNFQSFADLEIIHRIADRLFIEHQIACISGNWEEALNAMDIMYKLRIQNLQDAEDLLIPLYQSTIEDVPQGGALKFFIREHKLIKRNLDSNMRNISNIVLYNSGNEVNLVNLFEDYHTFKDLLDHYDARKRVFLYKLLDDKLKSVKWEPILQEINARYDKLMTKLDYRYEYA